MDRYDKFFKRVDLVQNQVARENLAEEKKSKLNKKRIQQQNAERFAEYQQILRAELEARIFANVSSTGGGTSSTGGEPSFSFGNALQFDGVNDYVALPENIALGDIATGNISFSGWVYCDTAIGATGGMLFDLGANALADNLRYFPRLIYNTTQNQFQLSNNNSFYANAYLSGYVNIFGNSNAIYFGSNTSNWHHIGFSTDCTDLTRLKIYADGVKIFEGRLNGNTVGRYTYTSGAFAVLGQIFNSTNRLKHAADEYAFFPTVLTDQQFADLYNNGNGKLATDIATPTWYSRFNGETGDTAVVDEIASNNGTLNNFNTATCWVEH